MPNNGFKVCVRTNTTRQNINFSNAAFPESTWVTATVSVTSRFSICSRCIHEPLGALLTYSSACVQHGQSVESNLVCVCECVCLRRRSRCVVALVLFAERLKWVYREELGNLLFHASKISIFCCFVTFFCLRSATSLKNGAPIVQLLYDSSCGANASLRERYVKCNVVLFTRLYRRYSPAFLAFLRPLMKPMLNWDRLLVRLHSWGLLFVVIWGSNNQLKLPQSSTAKQTFPFCHCMRVPWTHMQESLQPKTAKRRHHVKHRIGSLYPLTFLRNRYATKWIMI